MNYNRVFLHQTHWWSPCTHSPEGLGPVMTTDYGFSAELELAAMGVTPHGIVGSAR